MSLPLLAAHRVIVNSRFNMMVLASAIPGIEKRVQVIYNGIPGPPEVVPPRADLLPPIRLLFIGRLSPRKGPQVAIAALVELLAGGVEATLDILGAAFEGYEWFEESLRQQAAEADVSQHVRFLGFHSDVWPDIAAADIVLVPSVAEESFGNTAVEAILAARPLVVSASSGLLEAAGRYRSALLVEPDRPDLVAAAVRDITNHWVSRSKWAVSDADSARERHIPERFQTELAATLTELADAAT
jgi:glycosyltransferase involved in cell wall biosynthesis